MTSNANHYVGRIGPQTVIGKVSKRARRSSNHPSVTLEFSDNTVVQILVDSYNPVHRGIPKDLDVDPHINAICDNASLVNLTIINCIDSFDKAFERTHGCEQADELRWDQRHRAVAFNFTGENPTWQLCLPQWRNMTQARARLFFGVMQMFISSAAKIGLIEENRKIVIEADCSEVSRATPTHTIQ
jgi:hypothetical protein